MCLKGKYRMKKQYKKIIKVLDLKLTLNARLNLQRKTLIVIEIAYDNFKLFY